MWLVHKRPVRLPDRTWKSCLVVALLVLAVVLLYTGPRSLSRRPALQGGLINGVPASKLLQSPFLTHPPTPLLVPNPASNTSLPYATDSLHDDLTIVTAYVNLGRYWKGDREHGGYFTPGMYRQWMGVFRRMSNPVIAFFEEQEDVDLFKKIRGPLYPQRTKVYQIKRNTTWSFSITPLIKDIYSTPGYPQYHPGTVVPEYSSAMHLKYELMVRSVRHNPFMTYYFAWTDIGLFRSLTKSNDTDLFSLYVPPGLDDSKVAYGEVYSRSHIADIRSIFHLDRIWVCGCIFVAKASTMLTWSVEYLRATERYLRQRLMNTDQQVVYAITSEGHSSTQVQAYPRPKALEEWFHLGYTCKAAGAKRAAPT